MLSPRCRQVSFRLGATLGTTLLVAASPLAHGQMHHVEAPERVTRAIGVYEWTGDLSKPTAARFVPVSLFIDGHFEDAGLYLARPVPFAIQTGDVYALERAGEPEGLLDLDFARRVVSGKALADDNPEGAWYAYGRFTPEAAPKLTHLRPSGHLGTLQASAGPNTPAGTKLPTADPDDGQPHMSRRNPASSGSTGQAGSQTSTQTTGSQTDGQGSGSTPSTSSGSGTGTTSSGSSTDDDTDRPTLRRRDPSQDAARRREYGSKGKTSSVTAAGPALGDDPDRPILGHSSGEPAGTPELTGLPPDLHQAVAVSDATHNDAHPFAREWDSPAERAETLSAMAVLARARINDYLAVNQLVASSAPLPSPGPAATPATASPSKTAAAAPATASTAADADAPPAAPKLQRGVPQEYKAPAPAPAPAPPSANPAPPAAAGGNSAPRPSATHTSAATHTTHRSAHLATSHTATLTLGQEEISGYTLSYGGLPTFVYTGAASVTPAKAAATATSPAAPDAGPLVAYVTVVAQRLPSGELQMALSAVTDSAHLDRSPRLRLVDAVDPDDSHRASLLFEMRGATSRQFALYRLTAVHAEQTFTTASLE